MIFLVMDATRRVIGWIMVLLGAFFILQSAYGEYFFGIFYGPFIDWSLIINDLFMEEGGHLHDPISISASFVVLFIIFGAFIMRTGVGELFKDIAYGLMGRRSAVGQGCGHVERLHGLHLRQRSLQCRDHRHLHYPADEAHGLSPAFAGAVEACASTGGVFTPPVMGAVAFIMAEFLGVPTGRSSRPPRSPP